MTSSMLLLLLLVAPLLVIGVFRAHTSLMAMCLAFGVLLQQALADDAQTIVAGLLPNAPAAQITQGILLLLPFVLGLLFFKKTMVHINIFMQVLPLLLISVAYGYMLLAILPTTTQQDLLQSAVGGQVRQAQDVIIAAAVATNLLLAWRTYRVPPVPAKHK